MVSFDVWRLIANGANAIVLILLLFKNNGYYGVVWCFCELVLWCFSVLEVEMCDAGLVRYQNCLPVDILRALCYGIAIRDV